MTLDVRLESERPQRQPPGEGHARRLLAAAAVVLILAVPTAIQTSPRPSELSTHFPSNQADPVLLMWTMQYEADALVHEPGRVLEGNIFWPRRDAIAWSDMLLSFTPLYGAVFFASDNSVLAFNAVVFMSYLAGALAVFVFAREMLHDLLGALVAAAVFSFSTFRSVSVEHVQLAGFLFVPLALWFLVRFLERRCWRDAVGVGVMAAGTWLTSAYFAVLLALVTGAFLVTWLAQQRFRPGRRLWRGLSVAALVTAVLIGPTLLTYIDLQRTGAFAFGEVAEAELRGFVRLPPSVAYRDAPVEWRVQEDENALFPGLVCVALAAVALVRRRRTGTTRPPYVYPLAAGALVCGLLMLGPQRWGPLDWPYRAMREVLPGVASVRELTRFWVFPLFCLALLAGAGAKRVLARCERFGTAARVAVAVALLGLVCVEMLYRPTLTTLDLSRERLSAYEVLEELPPGPVTEVPVAFGWLSPYVLAPRQLRSLTDGFPRVEGYSGSFPPHFYTMQAVASAFPEPVAIEGLRRYGVRYVVVHAADAPCMAAFGPRETAALRVRLADAPGVARVIDAAPDFVVELEPARIDRDSVQRVPPVVRPVYPCASN